jgi:hypothetical protein
MKNHRFSKDPEWGYTLQRMHHGGTTKEDIELINTRVVGPDLTLPSLDNLEGADVTHACATNSYRNLICDNIFANILKHRHPKENENFEIPKQAIIIKGNFENWKMNEPKSSIYHKIIQSKCGDDNVQSGNGQNIIRVDPCLKLFNGCPIMVSTNDHKNIRAVKGKTAKFRGVNSKKIGI